MKGRQWSMKLLSFNITGFEGSIKWKYIKEITNNEDIGIICIQ